MRRTIMTILVSASLGTLAGPALAQATYEQRTGAVRSGTAVQGAYGNTAEHVNGPRGEATSVQGKEGGEMNHVAGPNGGATTVKTPSGQTYGRAHGRR
jgi:hypothetical protein